MLLPSMKRALTVFGLEDHWRFSLPIVEPRPHGLNISLSSLGRFHAIVAGKQMLFNMFDFPPRERAEQIRLEHLIVGVPARYYTHFVNSLAGYPACARRIEVR